MKLEISLIVVSMIVLFSCDYKKTHVINTVHEDGSVTRKVTVRTNTRKFLEPKSFVVPVNSTWRIETTMEVEEGGDTTWLLTAEKHFESVEAINEEYRRDLGSNRALKRSADFSRRFKWFTTVYRYTETVEGALEIDCPVADFLPGDELHFFHLPDDVQEDLRNGPDSLRIKEMDASIDRNVMRWFFTCEIRQWTEIFYDLFEGDPALQISREEMRKQESSFVAYLLGDQSDREPEEYISDSLFIAVMGEDFHTAFRSEIEYAVTLLHEMDKSCLSADNYNLEIRMPGRIIASNGYATTDPGVEIAGGIIWTVDPIYFLTESLEMWAESRVNNYLTWVLSSLFILFVAAGFIRRSTRNRSLG